jgi:electron transport complex protein RnfG
MTVADQTGATAPPTSEVTFAAPKPTSALRLVLTLGLAGLFSGLITVLVYEWTLPKIEAYRAEQLQKTVLEVVPGAGQMRALFQDETAAGGWRIEQPKAGAGPTPDLFAAYDDAGAFLGFALRGEGAGFQDVIRLLYGFDPQQRKLVGMQVLESRETPGLGDKIYKDQKLVDQWSDLAVDPQIELTKDASVNGANIIHAITGATISSRALVKIVNQSNEHWLENLPDPAPVEPVPPATETTREDG